MTTYYTSDTHLGHVNILGFCRPMFKDVSEMNEFIIRTWNSVVTPDDTVVHLGDYAMGPKTLHKGWFDRLNGHKILVRGNHDQEENKMRAMGWDEVTVTRDEVIDGQRVYMRHVPPRAVDPYGDRFYKTEFTPEPTPHDIWLCGHVHEKFRRRGNIINVGVDVWDFKPRTFEELVLAVDGT